MGGMKDTLGDTPYQSPSYPRSPGFKERGTSRAAAQSMASTAATLRADALRTIEASPDGMTADEVAAALGKSVLAIRPRITELASGLNWRITKSGRTRPNESGRQAAVWVAKGIRS